MRLSNPFTNHLRLTLLLIGLVVLLCWWIPRTVVESQRPTPRTFINALAERVVTELERAGVEGEILLIEEPAAQEMAGDLPSFLSALETAAKRKNMGPVSSETMNWGDMLQPRVPAQQWQAAKNRHPDAKGLVLLNAAPPAKYRHPDDSEQILISILPNEQYDVEGMLVGRNIHCAIVKRTKNLAADAGPFDRFYMVKP